MLRECFAVTVDIVLVAFDKGVLKVLLVKRKNSPYKGKLALPGGFVKKNEGLKAAALRELKEETGVSRVNLVQLHAFGSVNRDPRGRVVSVAYIALLPAEKKLKAATDATDAGWFSVRKLPKLSFDHGEMVSFALAWLKKLPRKR